MVEESSDQSNSSNSNGSASTSSNTEFKVLDSTAHPSPPKKHALSLDATDTGEEVRVKVAKLLDYDKDSFELKYGGMKIAVPPLDDRTLEKIIELSSTNGKPAPRVLYVNRQPGQTADLYVKEGSSQSSSSTVSHVQYGPYLPSTSSSSYTSSYGSSSSSGTSMGGYGYTSSWSSNYTPPTRSSTGFAGLSNQGATCYMNSLIQSLYMTPEFRSTLYKWSFEEKLKLEKENSKSESTEAKKSQTEEEKDSESQKKETMCIPLQLQRLFARLQTCDVQAVKTKDLTKSFGWEDSDAFTQHDVQELCRVLFDALEKNFAGTVQANIINDLYQGKMKDYVQCKECLHESARVDHYLDVPLVIRGFGETTAVKSVEEGFRKFVQPEVLEKDNQYFCEKCNKKVDAVKGLKFDSFPYILTLQLKRFDFDFNTMRRIKLNDRVTFPKYLDLNPFIRGPLNASTSEPDVDKLSQDLGATTTMDTDADKKPDTEMEDVTDWDAPAPVPSPELPYVYELYSVLIHRGNSMGGHYYAYIKSFEKNKWYEFNDSTVSEISTQDIQKAFGGDEDGPSMFSNKTYASFRSTSNAYMLMYRRIDPAKNVQSVSKEDIPESVLNVIQGESEAQKKKRLAEEKEKEMTKLKIYYKGVEKEFPTHKSTTLDEITKTAAEAFGVTLPQSCVRLRQYNHYSDLPSETYTGGEGKTLDQLGFHFGTYASKTLLMETCEPGTKFTEYDPSDFLFKVAVYDKQFSDSVDVLINKNKTLGDLKDALSHKFNIPRDKLHIMKESSYMYNSPPYVTIKDSDDATFSNMRFHEPEKLWIEYSDDIEQDSPAMAELERLKNLVEIRFNSLSDPQKEHKVVVDKNMTVKNFRELIQPMLGIGLYDFKIKRGTPPYCHELTAENETLSDACLRDGSVIIIEPGRPMKDDEIPIVFVLFDITKDDAFTTLWEVPVNENLTVAELKKWLTEKLATDSKIIVDAENLRLREITTSMSSHKLGKSLPNDQIFKKSLNLYSKKTIGIQVLSTPDRELNDKDLTIFVQHFKPSSFEITKKEDFIVNEDTSVDDFKAMLGEKYGIPAENVGLLRPDGFYSYYDDPDILDIPTGPWDKAPYITTRSNSLSDYMYLRNGSLVIARDNREELKTLTKEEKETIEKEAHSRKRATSHATYYSYSRKEKALKIQSE